MRELGPQQRRLLDLVAAAPQGLTVSELSRELDLTPRRCHQVVDSLRDRHLVTTTREQIGQQRGSGLPVWGVVAWTKRNLFERDADRWSASIEARAIARGAEAAREWATRRSTPHCRCCGQVLPSGLSLPTGPEATKDRIVR
jgi:predicted ArsR family transcriptional regulator